MWSSLKSEIEPILSKKDVLYELIVIFSMRTVKEFRPSLCCSKMWSKTGNKISVSFIPMQWIFRFDIHFNFINIFKYFWEWFMKFYGFRVNVKFPPFSCSSCQQENKSSMTSYCPNMHPLKSMFIKFELTYWQRKEINYFPISLFPFKLTERLVSLPIFLSNLVNL